MLECDNEIINQALLKKATGYDALEVITEYVVDDDGERVVKKKVTKKAVPPDITAIKMLLLNVKNYDDLSDEELLAERDRLIGLLGKST
ncbi:MAG: hypothetical protein J6B16_02900 [Clostridia bacterium]|nr:hypothetical protein [Clostridia bacterium]